MINEGNYVMNSFEEKLDTLIINTIHSEDQLDRIDKQFKAHMIRQISLELDLQKTLKEMKNGD